MNSIKLVYVIVEVICLVAFVNGNLITLDGQCPFADLKPKPVDFNGTNIMDFNSIAVTANLSGTNRSDVILTLEQTEPNVFKFTKKFRSKENGQCTELLIYITPVGSSGAFDTLYQVAPDTGFARYAAYFLSFDPVTLKALGLICHNLPNSQYQIELDLLSALTSEYDEASQEEVKKTLDLNNLGYLNQYMVPIKHDNKC